jgi:hypothetical protein
MNSNILAGSLLSSLVLTTPLAGQQVAANIFIHGGPIAGHVVVENGYSTYRHPDARRVVVVTRHASRVVLVERVRAHRHEGYWVRRGYRPVTLYYVDGRYYDRWAGHRAVREIVVYERNGRYYDPWDGHREHDRDYDHR